MGSGSFHNCCRRRAEAKFVSREVIAEPLTLAAGRVFSARTQLESIASAVASKASRQRELENERTVIRVEKCVPQVKAQDATCVHFALLFYAACPFQIKSLVTEVMDRANAAVKGIVLQDQVSYVVEIVFWFLPRQVVSDESGVLLVLQSRFVCSRWFRRGENSRKLPSILYSELVRVPQSCPKDPT